MTPLKLVLIAGDAHPGLARELAQLTDRQLVEPSVARFADGETRVLIEADLRGAQVAIVQPTSSPVNDRLMALALLADAARGAGAAGVLAVVPYFGYARQDVRKSPGEPRSAHIAARLLQAAGIGRIVTLELHAPALESAFDIPVAQLQADELLLPVVRSWGLREPAIVSPDAGGLKRAQRYAAALGWPLAAIAKARPRADVAAVREVLGPVRGRACVLVDDLASTGGTLAGAAQALLAAGAAEVHALFVHAAMAPGALDRIAAAGVQRIATTDSVGTVGDPRLQVVAVAPLFAAALR